MLFRSVCAASGLGAEIALETLPASPALLAAFDGERRTTLQATGGDDYELCFTASPEARDAIAAALARVGVRATRIGRMVAGGGVSARLADGTRWQPARAGHEHFATGG